MIILASLIGILGGLGAMLFRYLAALFHNLAFLGHFSFSYNESLHTPASIWGIGVVLVPVVGAVLVVWIIKTFAPGQTGLGVPEILYVIFCKDGRINPFTALAKTLAAAMSIGTGGSVGREGPVFQIGAALSVFLSDYIKVSDAQRKILMGAGVAACTGIIFDAPIAGIVFASEFLLETFTVFAVALIAISTALALGLEYLLMDIKPIFTIQLASISHTNLTLINLFLFISFGIVVGLLAIIVIRSLYLIEDVFTACFKNVFWRHITGMFLVGCLMFLSMHLFGHYYIEGIGFATIQDCLNKQPMTLWLLGFLIIGKLLATSLTLGTGASGGIFSPALFIGAALGNVFVIVVQHLFPGLAVDPVLFTLLGMASMLGSTTGAIITAIILTCEMMRNFDFIIPFIITGFIAYLVRYLLCPKNIYTLKLFRRGIVLPRRW